MGRAFIFPGQGSQCIGMAKEFYDNFSYVKKMFEEANDTLKKDLTKIMFEGPDDVLTQTQNAQPAIMLASAAILKVIKKETGKNIEELCDFVAGHSLGEYTALYAAKAISFSDALILLRARGEAFARAGKISTGSMVALVGSTVEQAEEVVKRAKIEGEILDIANDNTVGQIVLSGNKKSVEKVIEVAKELNIKRAIELNVSGAFHSELMTPAIDDMIDVLHDVKIKEPKVEIIANYTAEKEKVEDVKENLIQQITGRVRWRETMLALEKYGCNTFVEIGIGKVLSGMVVRTCPDVKVLTVNSIDTLKNFIDFIN